MSWPNTRQDLISEQLRISRARPAPWSGGGRTAGVFVCFPRGGQGPGSTGDPGWVAAAVGVDGPTVVATGRAGAPYEAGLLALREGPLLEVAVRALPVRPDVVLVNATGRDHPRRAGLALHLGAVLEMPTVGVTHRPLLGTGSWPESRVGATSPIRIGEEVVAVWLRTRPDVRPLAVHPGWRTDLEEAVAVVRAFCVAARTPEPLRRARQAAREARAADFRSSQGLR